ncbi:hypothetical protein JTB14_011166 [Gonioctena quinquepunctata]|nr:hypothetical protein JTB14_011166 [Gonioctena quinquepunctata]
MRNQTEKSRFSALYKSTKADLIKKALVDKYQVARSLATSYLDQILGFKHIQGESAKNLESFLEKFDCAVQALKNRKLQDLANFILMHQALAKLDTETVKSFEMSVRGRPLTGVPHEQVHRTIPSEGRTIPSEGSSTSEVFNTNTSTSENTNNNFHATAIKNRNNTVLLSTVVVNGSGQGQKARFLLDSGSQVHPITHKCSKKLWLKISRCFASVQGIGSNSVKGITDLI